MVYLEDKLPCSSSFLANSQQCSQILLKYNSSKQGSPYYIFSACDYPVHPWLWLLFSLMSVPFTRQFHSIKNSVIHKCTLLQVMLNRYSEWMRKVTSLVSAMVRGWSNSVHRATRQNNKNTDETLTTQQAKEAQLDQGILQTVSCLTLHLKTMWPTGTTKLCVTGKRK